MERIEQTTGSIMLFEDMDKVFDLTIFIGNKSSSLNISEQQAQKLKKDLDIEINYIPF